MHMFLPALPFAVHDLGTSTTAMQMTISVYIAGLAVGQLFYGPFSDVFGRRPLLIGGLALYTVASLAASYAPNIHTLIAARVMQALGGCAGLVLGRVIIYDTARSEELIPKLALLNLMIILGPGLGPIIGSTVTKYLGWRAIFVTLGLFGAIAFMASYKRLSETNRPTRSINLATLIANYRQLLCSPIFLSFALGGACITTAIYGFLIAAPFIFTTELHQSLTDTGIYLALVMLGFPVGNATAGRLTRFISVNRVLQAGLLVNVLSAVGTITLAILSYHSVATVIGLMFLFATGAGVASPVALAKSISFNPRLTGAAAGLYGTLQMSTGTIWTALVSMGKDPAFSVGCVLTLTATLAAMSFSIGFFKEKQVKSF